MRVRARSSPSSPAATLIYRSSARFWNRLRSAWRCRATPRRFLSVAALIVPSLLVDLETNQDCGQKRCCHAVRSCPADEITDDLVSLDTVTRFHVPIHRGSKAGGPVGEQRKDLSLE